MEDNQGWGGTKLEQYLRLESWETRLACGVLCLHLFPEETCTVPEAMARMNKNQREINRLFQLWSGEGSTGNHPPAYYIDWAISKESPPDWLDWAIERGLYAPKGAVG